MDTLTVDLQRCEEIDALVVSEGNWQNPEIAADLVPRYSSAPVILFRCRDEELSECKFELVCSPLMRPKEWLGLIAALIERKRAAHRDPVRVCRGVKAIQ